MRWYYNACIAYTSLDPKTSFRWGLLQIFKIRGTFLCLSSFLACVFSLHGLYSVRHQLYREDGFRFHQKSVCVALVNKTKSAVPTRKLDFLKDEVGFMP